MSEPRQLPITGTCVKIIPGITCLCQQCVTRPLAIDAPLEASAVPTVAAPPTGKRPSKTPRKIDRAAVSDELARLREAACETCGQPRLLRSDTRKAAERKAAAL